jgi:hypothetical protein
MLEQGKVGVTDSVIGRKNNVGGFLPITRRTKKTYDIINNIWITHRINGVNYG